MAKLRPEQLGSALTKSLAPIYIVTGEEPLSNLNEVLSHQLHQNGAVKTAIIP